MGAGFAKIFRAKTLMPNNRDRLRSPRKYCQALAWCRERQGIWFTFKEFLADNDGFRNTAPGRCLDIFVEAGLLIKKTKSREGGSGGRYGLYLYVPEICANGIEMVLCPFYELAQLYSTNAKTIYEVVTEA